MKNFTAGKYRTIRKKTRGLIERKDNTSIILRLDAT